jgi:hypothetical protein
MKKVWICALLGALLGAWVRGYAPLWMQSCPRLDAMPKSIKS